MLDQQTEYIRLNSQEEDNKRQKEHQKYLDQLNIIENRGKARDLVDKNKKIEQADLITS